MHKCQETRFSGRDSCQAILPDTLRVNANLFLTDLCRNLNYSAPLFEKEGLGGDFLNKSPSIPLFQRGKCWLSLLLFCSFGVIPKGSKRLLSHKIFNRFFKEGCSRSFTERGILGCIVVCNIEQCHRFSRTN